MGCSFSTPFYNPVGMLFNFSVLQMISIIIPNYHEPNIMKLIDKADDLQGRGKGWVIRQGLFWAAGDIIVFLDADMDIHPKMIKRLLPFLEDYDIVVGTKSIDKLLFKRKWLTFLSKLYVRMVFGLKVDTQTGIKIFHRYALPNWETDGFAFDIEILAKAKKLGYSMIEVPIDAVIMEGEHWRIILKTLKESLKIWLAL